MGSPIQAALDALEILRKQASFRRRLKCSKYRVRLATDEAAIVNNREIPDICLQHMLAVDAVGQNRDFRFGARQRAPERSRDASRARQNQSRARRGTRAPHAFARGGRGSHAWRTVRTSTQRVDNVRGTPENPMTRDEIIAKARDLITPVLGAPKCAKLDRAKYLTSKE